MIMNGKRTITSRLRKSKISMRSIMSCSLPGVPINKFAPSSSIFFMSTLTSDPPTRSIGLTSDSDEINGCATWNICDDNSLVGDMIIPRTCRHRND